MPNYIDYPVLETVLRNIYNFEQTKDFAYISFIQNEIKLARDLDYSIKTKREYAQNATFIESTHNPARMCMFLHNRHGEFFMDGGTLTIKNDDPQPMTNSHTNTYRLALKDPETHNRLYEGNPTSEDEPYDFNTEFISQITNYPNGSADSTAHAWESFSSPTRSGGYKIPARKIDFKGAFWSKGGEHNTQYILQLTDDERLICERSYTKERKEITFTPAEGAKVYYQKYFEVLQWINFFNQNKCDTWNKYIIN